MRKTLVALILVAILAIGVPVAAQCGGDLTEKAVEVRAVAVAKSAVEERGLPRPIKAVLKAIFTGPATLLVAVDAAVKKADTPVNILATPFRVFNTAKNQAIEHIVRCGLEAVTPWEKTEYANPAQLNWLGKRTVERGPFAQMFETAATVAPPVCMATGVIAPFVGLSQSVSIIATTAITAPGGVLVGEAVNVGEKMLPK